MIPIRSLDHLVLTVADIDASVAFYTRVLGMREVVFAGGRRALAFGNEKINLHQYGPSSSQRRFARPPVRPISAC